MTESEKEAMIELARQHPEKGLYLNYIRCYNIPPSLKICGAHLKRLYMFGCGLQHVDGEVFLVLIYCYLSSYRLAIECKKNQKNDYCI